MMDDSVLSFLIPIITFVLGFLVSRFTMSKKERKDYEQQQYENSKELMEAQQRQFQEFTTSLKKYASKEKEPTLDDFYEIATVGENYFYQLKITSDAILSGKVNSDVRDNTLVPAIREAIGKSLPTFYSTLQSIAQKRGIDYGGELKRDNYKSMYAVAEKYG